MIQQKYSRKCQNVRLCIAFYRICRVDMVGVIGRVGLGRVGSGWVILLASGNAFLRH